MTPNGKPTRRRRPSFSDPELKILYTYVGGGIGHLEAMGILEDRTARQISDDCKELVELQTKIYEALSNNHSETEEQSS